MNHATKHALTHAVRTSLALALVLGLGLGTGVGLVGCGTSQKGTQTVDRQQIEGSWDLVSLGGDPNPSAIGRGVVMTIDTEGRVSGFAGVNRFTGMLDTALLRDGRLKSGPVAATKMAGPEDAMRVEARFFEILEMGARWKLQSDATLMVYDDSGIIALFRRQTGE